MTQVGSIGERIRSLREARGLSQQAMADLGKVHRRTQVNYEADLRSPDTTYLSALRDAGLDVHFLLTGERAAMVTGDRVTFTQVTQRAGARSASVSFKSIEGVLMGIEGDIAEVRSRRAVYRVRKSDLRMVGERTALTEAVLEHALVQTEVTR